MKTFLKSELADEFSVDNLLQVARAARHAAIGEGNMSAAKIWLDLADKYVFGVEEDKQTSTIIAYLEKRQKDLFAQ